MLGRLLTDWSIEVGLITILITTISDGGITTDGQTNYINASTCDIRYNPSQWPVVFDLPKKDQ